MKKITINLAIIVAVVMMAGWQKTIVENPAHEKLRNWIVTELKSITSELELNIRSNFKFQALKRSYHKMRRNYKHVEFYVEYCSPREAKYFINGALVPKHDEERGKKMVKPQGFQRIEEILFDTDTFDKIELKKEFILLKENITSLIDYYKNISITDGQLLEMCQLQLFRIAALTLNGYDATITQTNVQEVNWCFEGLEKVISAFDTYRVEQKTDFIFSSIQKQINTVQSTLSKNHDYNSFDRLRFIIQSINPLNVLLVKAHNTCNLLWDTRKSALRLKQEFLFGPESFNLQFFSMYYDDTLHVAEQADIGKKLFFDPLLSTNNSRSCGTCHSPEKGFTDGLARSVALSGDSTILLNAPGLWNVAFQQAFFYNGRASQLEQQFISVLHNKNEMAGNIDDVVEILRTHAEYAALFSNAFDGPDAGITPYAVQKVITEYEKTLVSFNSRFDAYLRGNTTALNNREINGYNVFSGKALCGSCHFLPVFNGTVPPFYTDTEFEILGVPKNNENNTIDEDKGRFNVTGIEEHMFSFKTPTVRNISVTAPYMHNGVYATLEEVIEFYHKGGGKGLGYDVPNQTLPFDSLNLNPQEKEDIILFLKSLTDTAGVNDSY